ncbi:MAG: pentapeptide MXKDX repeat protein, partial [Methylocella sp.]
PPRSASGGDRECAHTGANHEEESKTMNRRYAFTRLAALALVAAGSLFAVAASAEDNMKPESTKPESMKADHMKHDAMHSDGMKADTMKSGHMESNGMKSGHTGGDTMGTQK